MDRTNNSKTDIILFKKGEKIINIYNKKTGTIDYLRNDSWEKKNNHPYNRFYYSVSYDDGTFETYENITNLKNKNVPLRK
uniref:Uncharacterized protein n=1 Tax=Megaviridae environmental sample TaxID=1737588 RepID=A0A5J6VK84_9VIRU|nr:MAG: hypothetical protein [Megaviridae environmental sample]